jgi:ketosteroid isomerase-like protein
MLMAQRTIWWRAAGAAACWMALATTLQVHASAHAADAEPSLAAVVAAEGQATVKAFDGGDAAALANMFLETGEVVDEDGGVVSGRAAIADLFGRFFARFPKATLAMEEGVRRITTADGTAAQMRYVAVRSKQGGRWPIASYREFADDPLPTPREMLSPLEWLVGEWVDESGDGKTTIRYEWTPDGNFLVGEYDLTVGGDSGAKSVQRIGFDPVQGMLRSWTFDSDGGFSEGEWSASGDGWLIRSQATMPDGSTGRATVTITPRDADHFVVESTDRFVAGAAEQDFRMVVARKPPAPAAQPAGK